MVAPFRSIITRTFDMDNTVPSWLMLTEWFTTWHSFPIVKTLCILFSKIDYITNSIRLLFIYSFFLSPEPAFGRGGVWKPSSEVARLMGHDWLLISQLRAAMAPPHPLPLITLPAPGYMLDCPKATVTHFTNGFRAYNPNLMKFFSMPLWF